MVLDMDRYRGAEVADWLRFDATLLARPSSDIEVGLTVKNLTGEEYYLVKNIAFPCYYRQEGRRFLASLRLTW